MKKPLPTLFCKHAKATLPALAILLLASGLLNAQTTRYVGTLGLDAVASGSILLPYKTISYAISRSVNGDTIKVLPGTYPSATTTTVSKSVVIVGTGVNSSDVILSRGSYGNSLINGFTISVSNVLIKNLKITNYQAGITNLASVTNLTLDNVQLVENFDAGFSTKLKIDGLTIKNSTISFNGNKGGVRSGSASQRGIYLNDVPSFSAITFDNNIIENNGIAGIDISAIKATTSINGITITNNTVRNNGDAQITAWLGTSNGTKNAVLISNNTVVLSDSARIGIMLRNPAGNGQLSGTGSVVISNNNISATSSTGNSRDMAAIAVIRKKEGQSLAAINDQPQGVVVFENTIADFQNLKSGDAYGIVFGGFGHKVYNNIISNTEFSIQLQKGNANYALNTNAPDVSGQPNDAYFNQDNSKDVCVEVGSNTISSSGAVRLATDATTTSLILPAKRTTNTSTGETFCTIQQAIDFQGTVNGNTITANAGIYDEQVIVNKGLIIDGIDSSSRIATFTGTATGTLSIFTIATQNVTIKNFKFVTDLTKINSAIMNSGDASNLLVTSNSILSDLSIPGSYRGGYSTRNGIAVNAGSNIIVKSNTFDARDGGTFRAAIQADNIVGMITGGDNISDGNNFLASINHDVLIRNYAGDQIVKNNIIKGGGVEVALSTSDGIFLVSNNTFDGTYAQTIPTAMVRIFTNAFENRTVNFSYNHFINQKWTVSFENTRNVTLDHNDFTATYDSFRLISVNTKLRQSSSPATLEKIDIKLTNNTLSAITGLTTGTALEFLNFDERPGTDNYINGNYVIGEIGNENSFNENIPTFVKVSNLDNYNTAGQPFLDLYPEYSSGQFTTTTGYWKRDIFARHNRFYVNGSLKLASDFSADDFNKVYNNIFDRKNDINVGAVVLMPTWSGAVSTDWSDNNNWSYQFTPAAGLDAVVYPQINMPVLTSDAACDTLILSNGMTVTTGTHNLTLFGNLRSDGVINADMGNLVLGGTVSQYLSGFMMVKNLQLNNPNGAEIAPGLGNQVTLRGAFTPTSGILKTNNNLVLKSDAQGTASVGIGNNAGGYIVGNVTVERYLSAHKAWRFLSVPTSTVQSVKQTWQENAVDGSSNPKAGYGTQITSNRSTWKEDGFDLYSAGGPSMKTYNPLTDSWVGIPNTSSFNIKDTDGYMVFVRGDRLSNAFNSPVTETVLRTKGELYMGKQPVISVLPNKLASIGNPYASPVDFTLLPKGNGIDNKFYAWDPLIPGYYNVGGYQTLSEVNGWKPVPGGSSLYPTGVAHKTVESGQAFFVHATPPALLPADYTISFSENSKVDANAPINFAKKGHSASGSMSRPGSTSSVMSKRQLLDVTLFTGPGANAVVADGNVVAFDNLFSNDIDGDDALKIIAGGENFGIKRNGKVLAIEARNIVSVNDTIYYNMTNLAQKNYQLRFAPENMQSVGLQAFLADKFLGKETIISLVDSTFIDAIVTSDALSKAADRYKVIFRPMAPLAVTFTSIKATQKNADILVEWTVENEKNISKYEVEKSLDGNKYAKATTVTSNNGTAKNYNWLDQNVTSGYNYYRVRSVDVNGQTALTQIVKVLIGKTIAEISVYPNPAINGVINLQLNNMPAGIYNARILNPLGQSILGKRITYNGGTISEPFILEKNAARGIYQVEITSPSNDVKTIKVMY